MHHKNVLLVAHTKRCVASMQDLKQALDVSILSSTPQTIHRAFDSGHEFDLIIIDTLDLDTAVLKTCLLYTSPSPRDVEESRMPSSA